MTMILGRTPTIERRVQPGTHRGLDISIGDLETFLVGVAYPATKQDLIGQAKRNGASDDVMTFLRLLPEAKHHRFQDIAFMAWSFLII